MRLSITAKGLTSFEDGEEPAGFITPADRRELERRAAEVNASTSAVRVSEDAQTVVARRAEASRVAPR